MVQKRFNVTGMSCSSCSACVDGAVRKLNGGKVVSVSLFTNAKIVEFDEAILESDAIVAAVVKSGFGASAVEEPKPQPQTESASEQKSNTVAKPESAHQKFTDIAATELAAEGKTPIFFATGSDSTGCSPMGIVAVADPIKETSFKAIEEMKRMGLKVMMLTGDNRLIAQGIKQKLGLDAAIAEVLPQDKEMAIRKLQEAGEKIVMVGDGINDAPALVRADIGMAIGLELTLPLNRLMLF